MHPLIGVFCTSYFVVCSVAKGRGTELRPPSCVRMSTYIDLGNPGATVVLAARQTFQKLMARHGCVFSKQEAHFTHAPGYFYNCKLNDSTIKELWAPR